MLAVKCFELFNESAQLDLRPMLSGSTSKPVAPKSNDLKATERRWLFYHVPRHNIEYSICDGLQLFRNDDMRSKRRSCESDEVSQDKRSQSVNCVNNFSAIFAFAIEAVDQCLSVLLMS